MAIRRATTMLVIVLALCLVPHRLALGWSNGTGGCNSFGTHDWILKKAIRAAGNQASWVRVQAHQAPPRGGQEPHGRGLVGPAPLVAPFVASRCAPPTIRTVRERAASRALGLMSLFVADVAQPMHTDSSNREDRVHGPYESAVDRRIPDYPFRYDGHDAARPAQRTRRVARAAHEFYRELVRAYDNHGYNAKVHRITKRQLKRAANATADLITSLK